MPQVLPLQAQNYTFHGDKRAALQAARTISDDPKALRPRVLAMFDGMILLHYLCNIFGPHKEEFGDIFTKGLDVMARAYEYFDSSFANNSTYLISVSYNNFITAAKVIKLLRIAKDIFAAANCSMWHKQAILYLGIEYFSHEVNVSCLKPSTTLTERHVHTSQKIRDAAELGPAFTTAWQAALFFSAQWVCV